MPKSKIIKKIVKKLIFYKNLKEAKQTLKVSFDKRRRVKGENKFTIVAAVYNVEKYLEDFFESIVNQTLRFEDHIFLIMVDDGSPDSSAQTIKKWQKKYPNNITYVKKENGGQASARNVGIDYVKTEWVTFVDPDDFLDYRYFEEIDTFLQHQKNNNNGLISCNTLYYFDDTKKLKNDYYLKFCFSQKTKTVCPKDMKGCIQFSASSSIFKTSLINKHHIRFSETLKPNFEDAHFVNSYLIANDEIEVSYLKNAKYMYRKRSDGTSTMDRTWKSRDKYLNVPQNGYLDLLQKAEKKYGAIPVYIQRTILSEMTGYLSYLTDHPERIAHLSDKEKNIFLFMIKDIFTYIDEETIQAFNLFGTWYMNKVGYLGAFKHSAIKTPRCYIDKIDLKSDSLRIRLFSYDDPNFSFHSDDSILEPSSMDIIEHTFMNTLFLQEMIIWIPLSSLKNKLHIFTDDKQDFMIDFKGKVYQNGIDTKILHLERKKLLDKESQKQFKKLSKQMIKKAIKRLMFYDDLKKIKVKVKTSIDKRRRVEGKNQFTIVAAVYNVEKYLEDFFESIVNQTLRFEDHIYLIMVDDGSPDNSATIIKKWQQKYPDNIVYIKKENGGQASARNVGIDHVQTEWVTFVDPDDFLDYRYFEEVDHYLQNTDTKECGLISCNFIFFYEDQNRFSDTHPLKFRFSQTATAMKPNLMERAIQLTVNSVFFRTSKLREKNILFPQDVRPSFEDGFFVNQYMIEYPHHDIVFLKNAKYYYRKRSDGTSTLDTSWKTLDRYSTVLQNGYLKILKYAMQREENVPLYLQRTILYELMWNHSFLLNAPGKLSHLNSVQKKHYIELITEMFSFIDTRTILTFDLAGCWFLYKVAYLGFYKREQPSFQICYVDEIDTIHHQVKLHWYHTLESKATITLEQKNINQDLTKRRRYTFADDDFVYESILWISYKNPTQLLQIKVDEQKTLISLHGKQFANGISMTEIVNAFPKPVDLSKISPRHMTLRLFYNRKVFHKKYSNTWIFIDRDVTADDNAEHLYRYVSRKHPEKKIYFGLNKNSKDWERLSKEGFNLLPYNSIEYKAAYFHAQCLLSSNADHYITDYFPRQWYRDIIKHKFVFLQHGVIHTDLSRWLNTKSIDCFICSAPGEYHSITDDNTRYKFTVKETILTGLPRHDALIENKQEPEKMLLVMPTWREYLIGDIIHGTHKRSLRNDFIESEYFRQWQQLLCSKELQELCNTYGYQLSFFPHSNIRPYLHMFNLPDHVNILTDKEVPSLQALFQKAALMITDYSSVAFDMALLEKNIIYYQFDHQEVLEGKHTFIKGYFDYERDGFGPVCYRENTVIDSIAFFLKSPKAFNHLYQKRFDDFFLYRDTNNCHRVYQAVINLF